MARYWRIAQQRFALDRSCEGSRLHGGRWNKAGFGALYASTSVELATLEKLVHTSGLTPRDLLLVAVDVPDDDGLTQVAPLYELPKAWNALPGSDEAQAYGTRWLRQAQQLVLLLPSVIVPEARNALINPLHPRFGEVSMAVTRPFDFDPRMFR
ncbi:MAG: RES family NAD+ phosphorylase [Betaproteobacteria bacterium]|nr:RES family NAD+ phosphorylase [Betaproteobacteria bacterium]